LSERLEPAVLGELLGLLAHDLRNPLSALHSNLGFLKSVLTSAEQDVLEAVDDSVVSCEGLAHIIDNIDLLGRSLRPATGAEMPGADVGRLVGEVVAASGHMARSHGVTVELPEVPDGTFVSRGARDAVERAIVNLLRNSIQHSPSGGTVKVWGRSDSKGFVVTIADSGSRLTSPSDEVFTAAGQLQAKSVPFGRYSRGLGLYCAGLAAAAGHSTVRTAAPPPGTTNAFELVVELVD
jgi:signal transduction histidine kinase